MITSRIEAVGQPFEYAIAIVGDLGMSPCIGRLALDLTAEGLANALMAEADAENGNLA